MKQKNSFIHRIYRKKDIEKVQSKIDLFGAEKPFTVDSFMNKRLLTSLLVFIVVFIFIDYGVILAPVLTVIWYFLYTYLQINRPLKLREEKLNSQAYYYFEVLTLALESGRNLENAIKMACKYIDSDISKEFKQVLHEISLGKSLTESLTLMNRRIPSLTINNIILNMQQSSMFGNSIIETMYNQLDFLRDKQVNDTRAKINQIPNKISIFSVIFFIPLMLLIILGPVLVRILMG